MLTSIEGPMWYGAMGTFQILLFALIAIKIKANAPGAHTFPEIVLARHGKIAHITYLFNGLATNMLVGACLVLGGSQVVTALTGMNVYAACFLSKCEMRKGLSEYLPGVGMRHLLTCYASISSPRCSSVRYCWRLKIDVHRRLRTHRRPFHRNLRLRFPSLRDERPSWIDRQIL